MEFEYMHFSNQLKRMYYKSLTGQRLFDCWSNWNSSYHYKIAIAVKADGVHLGKTDACPKLARKHLYSWQIIGGTANTLEECELLIAKEVDYISLSPFRLTPTKTDLNTALGLNGYAAI